MNKVRILVVSSVLALFTIIPLASPANAGHNCGLEDVDRTVDTICDNYHNPKPLISYLVCLISPNC